MPESAVPLDRIPSRKAYAIHADGIGLISEHETATEAIKGFALYARKNIETEALIYRREEDGWSVF